MDDPGTVLTVRVGPEDAPAVGARMSISEERSAAGQYRVVGATLDADGPWVVTAVSLPDVDGAVDVCLARVTEGDAALP